MFQKTLICLVILFSLSIIGIRGVSEEEDRDHKSMLSLCKCAQSALREMRVVLAKYTRRLKTSDPMKFDHVIGNITDIAYSK